MGDANPLPMRAHRLLAIDDHADSANLVVRIAQKCGYEAEALTDEADLSASLQNDPPDILSLDLCMPDQDGIRIMSVLQQHQFKGQILIISGQDEWLRKSAGRLAMARGLKIAADMAKPIDLPQLMQLLQKLRAKTDRTEAA
ncbi:MAG TPA: response regulator [Stellaceae bacterium]|jgi:two-component system chemotaxis response regulator CheB|nr:response regulator [Stellaceae bacterium]